MAGSGLIGDGDADPSSSTTTPPGPSCRSHDNRALRADIAPLRSQLVVGNILNLYTAVCDLAGQSGKNHRAGPTSPTRRCRGPVMSRTSMSVGPSMIDL